MVPCFTHFSLLGDLSQVDTRHRTETRKRAKRRTDARIGTLAAAARMRAAAMVEAAASAAEEREKTNPRRISRGSRDATAQYILWMVVPGGV